MRPKEGVKEHENARKKEDEMGILSGLTLGTKRPLRVAAYCRVSTDEELQLNSYESQREFFKKEIFEHPDWELVAIYGDKAMTGISEKRRYGFQRMISHAELGTIDYIIMKSLSRFSRSTVDTIKTLQKLKALGVGVYFMEQGIDTLSDIGDLAINALATIAENESESLSLNMKATLNAMNEAGTPVRKSAYGYRKVGKEWVIIPKQEIRVKLAFLMATEGYTFTEIANRLNQFEERDRTKRRWELRTVKWLLTNEAYIGDILTNKNVAVWDGNEKKLIKNNRLVDQFYIEHHHEPMIGIPLFEKIQAMYKAKELAGQPNFKGIERLKQLAERDTNLRDVRKFLPNEYGRVMRPKPNVSPKSNKKGVRESR